MTIFIMMIGMIASGFSPIFVKSGNMDPFILASYRQLLAALLLIPLFIRDMKQNNRAFHIRQTVPSILPGIFLGLHFILWVIGARLIPGAHSSVIVTMGPVFMPFIMYFMLREKITILELAGSFLALSGVFFLGLKDSEFAAQYIKGDFLVFLAMIMVTLYLAFARKNRKNSLLWFYMVPLYITGGLLCFIIGLITGADLLPRSGGDWISILGLAIVSTIIGHSINNYGMRKLRGQVVSLLNLTQIIFATLLSFLILGEIPPAYFYPAAIVILSGPLLVILMDKPEKKT
jgi:drug/metabolite transporter (DMT)-like permease